MKRKLFGAWIFDVVAGLYDFMTANEVWQASCARLLDHIPRNQRYQQILDLGTGPANSAVAMGQQRPDVDFIGFDLSQPMLAIAQKYSRATGWSPYRLSLLRGDALRLPLVDSRLDAVTAHSFLYLLPDPQATLLEVRRVLRKGGRVAFLEPHQGQVSWSWLWRQRSGRLLLSASLWRFYSGMHGRFSNQKLRASLEQTGFVDIDTEVTLGGFGIFGRAKKP